jgi:hypothetical protein
MKILGQADILAEIWTQHPSATSLERYRYTNMK